MCQIVGLYADIAGRKKLIDLVACVGLAITYPAFVSFTRQRVNTHVVDQETKSGASLPPSDVIDAPPGSEAKILLLIARAERGESLFCDDDYNWIKTLWGDT